jgi:hypothetical protein
MFKTQGMPCKTLRGKPFETHKIDPYDFMAPSKTFWRINFIKAFFVKIILKKLDLPFDFRNNSMFA